MSTTYLMIGGAGNLSRQLAAQLVGGDYNVVLSDIVEPADAHTPAGCTYVRCDVTEPDQVESLLADHQPHVVLHMASLLSGKSEQDRPLAMQVNVVAAFHVFEAAVRHGVRTVFFPSSMASFGSNLPETVGEEHPQWPQGIYGVTKVACERLGAYYHDRHGLDFRCIRVPTVISKFAHPGAASAYASMAFIETVRTGQYTFKLNPTTRTAIVYVRDVLEGFQQMVTAPKADLTRRVYNMYSLSPTTQQIADAIVARLPEAQLTFEPDESVVSLVESWPKVLADDTARRDWGWSPQYDLQRMTDDFIKELELEFADARGV